MLGIVTYSTLSPTSVLVRIIADHDLVHYLRLSGHQKSLIGHEIQHLWTEKRHVGRTPSLPKRDYIPTRWAPTSYKLSYNPYKWPYKGVTGVITAISGVIILLITGRGPLCKICFQLIYRKLTCQTFGKGTSLTQKYRLVCMDMLGPLKS